MDLFSPNPPHLGIPEPQNFESTQLETALDPSLKDALGVVHRMQRADPEVRKRFARSPQAYIREALGDQIDEPALETLFLPKGPSGNYRIDL